MHTPKQHRIPLSLQEVFLKSQAGEDLTHISVPSNGVAFRIYENVECNRMRPLQLKREVPSARKFVPMARMTAPMGARKPLPTTSRHALTAFRAANKNKETAADIYKKSNPISIKAMKKPIDTPQGFLEAELERRGYSSKKYVSTESGYYCRPTALQKASHGSKMNEAVIRSDAKLLTRLLDAGLSANPCNDFGESMVHRICRRGDAKLLKVLMEHGCCLQVADDYGRTPLHDAFWKADPSIEVVNLIMKTDKHLIRMVDARGFAPLDYVRKGAHAEIIEYLKDHLDEFFPPQVAGADMVDPPLTKKKPDSTPVPDPCLALSPSLAALVANGEIEPEDALDWDDESSSYDSDDYDSDDDEYEHSESADSCMSDLESVCGFYWMNQRGSKPISFLECTKNPILRL